MKKTKNFERALWVGTAILACVLLMSHTYNDIVVTTRHGINFWNILKDGKLLEFYSVNRMASGNVYYNTVQGCAYNILVYLVFAVWNLPLYLLERFAGVDVMNAIPCLVYSKLLIAVCMGITVLLVKKIMEDMKIPEKQQGLMLYLYASSALLLTVVFLTGQYDMFSLVFQMLGFRAFVKGKDKAFALWFGVAFCFKYFAAVIFLPLLLLREKKVLAWIKNLVLLLIPVLITKLPFLAYGLLSGSAASAGSGGDAMAGSFMVNMLTSSNVNVGVNLFILAYAAILVWCYLQDSQTEQRGAYGIWVCMLAYGAFFGLMNAYPYWSVLMAPFATLAIAMAPEQLYLNLILETVGYAGLVGVNMVRYPWVYFGNTLKPMVLPRILAGSGFDVGYGNSRLYRLIDTVYTHPQLYAVINSMFVAAMAALAYTTYPKRTGEKRLAPAECGDVLALRFLINAVICLLPIIAVFL